MSARFTSENGFVDIVISPNHGFDHDNFFDDIILVCLFEEKRADEREIFAPENRSGWMGNESLDFERGSKIWLYKQSRITRSVINSIKSEADNSLNRIVENGYAEDFETKIIYSEKEIGITVKIKRFDNVIFEKYYKLWDNSAVTEI